MDIEIKDPKGDVVLSQTGMLGEQGHLALPNDVAPSPYAVFVTTTELEPRVSSPSFGLYGRFDISGSPCSCNC